MALTSRAIPIPGTYGSLGIPVDISDFPGEKTVLLSNSFSGYYVLLASHDDDHFAPVAVFQGSGTLSFETILGASFSSLRLLSRGSHPAGMTAVVSGNHGAGNNGFAALPTVPAGAYGPQAAVDLFDLVMPAGLTAGTNVILVGQFRGSISVEGSLDGSKFSPVAVFRCPDAAPSSSGLPSDFEFSPAEYTEQVRYLRVNVLPGAAVLGPLTATVGGQAQVISEEYVPVTRTVNGYPLSADVDLSYADVGADPAGAAAAITLAGLGGVPTSRTVNGQALSANVSLSAADVGADPAGAAAAITLAGLGGVPTSRTVNGQALSGNVSLSAADVGADPAGAAAAITLAGLGGVPTSRTVNSKALSANITLSAADVGADPAGAAAAITLAGLGGVPTSRTINGISLAANVVLNKVVSTTVNAAGPYAVLVSDYVIIAYYTTIGACSIQLPAVATVGNDFILVVCDGGYNASNHNITLLPSGTDRIDNVAGNYVMSVSGQVATLVATTNPNTTIKNWQII